MGGRKAPGHHPAKSHKTSDFHVLKILFEDEWGAGAAVKVTLAQELSSGRLVVLKVRHMAHRSSWLTQGVWRACFCPLVQCSAAVLTQAPLLAGHHIDAGNQT